MTKKSTKKALLRSALSLVLCVTMLIGTTFAWFTDSVTSSNNIIKSGNLDVELYYQNSEKTTWTKVEENTNVFLADALWEPGHTEVIKFKVANEGSLALKYQLGVNIVNEKGSINKDGNQFKLSDYIYFGVVDGNQDYNRVAAIDAVKDDAKQIKSGFTKENYLVAGQDSAEYVTMVVYMPETVGNEANYKKGEKAPEIQLGLNLFATQYTYEKDSFDNQYDADAIYYDVKVNTVDELYTAVENASGQTVIAVDGNITLTKALSKSGLESIKFVGWDDDATIDQAKYNMSFSGAKVTFEGLTLTHGEKTYGNGGQTSTAFAVWDAEEVNYLDCTFNRSVGTIHAPLHNFIGCTFNGVDNPGNTKSEYPLYICDGQDYNVIDCTFNCTNRGAILFYNDGGSGVDTLNISNTKFLGDIIDDKTAVEIHNNSKSQVYNVNIKDVIVGNGIVNGLYRIKPANVGEVNVNVDGVIKVATASDKAGLIAAISNAEEGETIYLNKDVNVGATQLTIDEDITVDLNGQELTNSFGHVGMIMKAGSIENGTVNYSGNVGAISVRGALGSIENVEINVTPKDGKTITGIQLVNGNTRSIDIIKNVTIVGASQGIEVKDCSPNGTATPAIGYMENVNIDATNVGMIVNGYIGQVKNCNIKGANVGINMMLKGEYKVTLELVDCVVTGGTAGIWGHDEVGIPNTTNCSLSLTYDAATKINGGLVWEFEDECLSVVTLNAPN